MESKEKHHIHQNQDHLYLNSVSLAPVCVYLLSLNVAMIMRIVTQISFPRVTLSLQGAFHLFKDILIQKAGCSLMRTSVGTNRSYTMAAILTKLTTTGKELYAVFSYVFMQHFFPPRLLQHTENRKDTIY